MTSSNIDLLLFFDGRLVGTIKDAFCSEKMWYGKFENRLEPNDELSERVLGFIDLCLEWHDRADWEMADPKEFDAFQDVLAPGRWAVQTNTGEKNVISAPVFLSHDQISWR